jgi:hypothetical protein
VDFRSTAIPFEHLQRYPAVAMVNGNLGWDVFTVNFASRPFPVAEQNAR